MQDTPNPHLEVESREPVLAVKRNKLQANRAAQMLALPPSNSDLGCGRVPSCAFRRAFFMRYGGFPKYNGPESDQNSATETKVTEPLFAGSPGDVSVAARGPKSILIILGNCHAKARDEATRRRRACRCKKAPCNITAPRCEKSAGSVAAAPSRKISGDTLTWPKWTEQIVPQGGPATTRKGAWRPGRTGA